MFEEKIKTQNLLYGLKYHKRILNKLLNRKKEYDLFLVNVIGLNELFEEARRVYVKEVAQKLGINSAKIRKYLEQIYDDIIEFLQTEDRTPIITGNVNCSISIKDRFNKYFYIENIHLNIIPREGETIEIPFLFPYFRYTYLEVYKVYHEIDYNVHKIHLELRRKLNRFVRFKEDEKDYKDNMKYYHEEMNWFHRKKYYTFKRGEWKESW